MFTFTNRVPHGFALMVWQLQNVGGLAGLIAKCHQYGIDGIFLKGADGDSCWTSQFNASVVAQLHAAGIGVIGWQYVYGGPGNGAPSWSSVAGEIAAAKYILSTGADGYLFDDEVEYDGKPQVATQVCQAIRAAYPYASIGYNPYPYPSSDVNHPFFEFNGHCDYCMPQLYQGQDHLGTPAQALAKMEADFAHWSPIWAARPGGRAAIPLCIDWQGASWAGATIPDSDIADAARVSVGTYPAISYWDMDSLTAGEWAGVAQASAIWHGTATGTGGKVMWTQQAGGGWKDAAGHIIGDGCYAWLVAHNMTGAQALASETWSGDWAECPFDNGTLLTVHKIVDASGNASFDVSNTKDSWAWLASWSQLQAAQAQITTLQAQVASLQAQLAKATMDPTLAARAAAFEQIKTLADGVA